MNFKELNTYVILKYSTASNAYSHWTSPLYYKLTEEEDAILYKWIMHEENKF